MAKVNNKRVYNRFSRLRYYNIIEDEQNALRLGMKNTNFINRLKNNVEFEIWRIPPNMEYRPDSISNFFYGTPELWWVLQEYNEFFRMPQDFYVDRPIRVPDSNQLISLLL